MDRLRNEGIKFVEKNVSTDPVARSEMQQMGLMGVPAFKLDDQSFTGLDLSRIKDWIDYALINCPKCQVRMRVPKGKNKLSITCPSCQHQFKLVRK